MSLAKTATLSVQQIIRRDTEKLHLYLRQYTEPANIESLSQFQIEIIKKLITFTVAQGSDLQKARLYFILLKTRASLFERNEIERRKPIVNLTHFFKFQCPLIADQLEKEISAEAQKNTLTSSA